ncbi:EamA family transporter, partial [Neisseria sp. P0021.S007]
AMMCTIYSVMHLPLATGVTLNYTSSIWLAIFSFFILKERITLYTQAILVMGFIGVILLLNPSFQGGQEFAALVSLAGGAMSGWAYLKVRELSLLGEPGWRVVFYLSLTGLIMSAIWSCFTGWHPLTVSSLPYLAGIGISAMIAQLAMTRAYK